MAVTVMHIAWPKAHSKNHVTRENQSTYTTVYHVRSLFEEPRERSDCCRLFIPGQKYPNFVKQSSTETLQYFQKSMRDIA